MASQTKILELQNLSKSFGGLQAVSDVSFSIETGKVTALIGPNGAGKTTVLNMISGVFSPTQGRILYNGEEIAGLPAHQVSQKGISRTFQIVRLFPALTVKENVMLGRDFGCSGECKCQVPPELIGKQGDDYAMTMLGMFDLQDQAELLPHELSFGQQRWLELARAMAMEPNLLLLDEPASGLSLAEAEGLLVKMRSLCQGGCTILLIEHNMRVMTAISDYVVVLNHGQKLMSGTPDEVKNDPEVIEVYLGEE